MKRRVLAILAALVMFMSAVGVPTITKAQTTGPVWEWTRLEGTGRYSTMAAITDEAYPASQNGKLKSLIVATGDDYPDALSGAALAGVLGCPIITTKTATLRAEAKKEIERLASKDGCTVYILGGPVAVSEEVETAISKIEGVKEVKRIQGTNREMTAIDVYNLGKVAENGFAGNDTFILATGGGYADTLSISPYAYASKTPIFLTRTNGSLRESVKDVLIDPANGFKKAIIVGGTTVVTEETEKTLKENNIEVLRLFGKNRYLTSVEIVKWELGLNTGAAIQPAVQMKSEGMGIATGQNFPDALASANLLGKTKSVLLLVKNVEATDKPNIDELIAPYTDKMTKGYIFGGTSAVTEATEALLNAVVPTTTIYETPEEILTALYGLGRNEKLSDGHLYELEGKIKSVDTQYDASYNNVSVTIEVEGFEDKPVQAFRLTAKDAEMYEKLPVLKANDKIKVRGVLKDYNGKKEFDAGCLLIGYEEGTEPVVIYETPEEILKALYALGDNEVLSGGYEYELEGKITAINTEYNSQYNNITVTMVVEGLEEYPVQAYRLTAENTNAEMSAALKVLKEGDTIKVKGALKNYVNSSGVSTKEFVEKSLLIGYEAGETPELTDKEKIEYEADRLSLPDEFTEAQVFELPTPVLYEEVEVSWISDSDLAVVDETAGTLTITLPENEDKDVNITATLKLPEWTATIPFVVTIRKGGETPQPEDVTWTKVAWDAITEDDVIAITMSYTKDGTTTTWILPTDPATSSGPKAVVVTPSGNTLSTKGKDGFAWVRETVEGDYRFRVETTENHYLMIEISTSNNNGVRIDVVPENNYDSIFVMDQNYGNGYLKAKTAERYLGVYRTNPDWRSYMIKNNTFPSNITNETIEFWKLDGGEEPPVEPTDDEKLETEYLNLNLGSISVGPGVVSEDMTYPLPLEGGTYPEVKITWESNKPSVAVVDGNLVITQIDEEVVAEVTATLTLNSLTREKTFTVTVTAKEGGEEPEEFTETFVFSELYGETTNLDTVTLGDIVLAFTQETSNDAPKYNTSGKAVRFYAKNRLVVRFAEGKAGTLTKIVINFSGESYAKTITADHGGYVLEGAIGTWTGSVAEEGFVNSDTAQARIASIVVTYVLNN